MITLKRAIFCIPFLLFAVAYGNGQELLIDQVKKTVVYLQGSYPCSEPRTVNGAPAVTPEGTPRREITICSQSGTGFLIQAPTPEFGPQRGLPLLVTSKHLIQHQSLGAPKGVMEYFNNIAALANTIQPNSGGVVYCPNTDPCKRPWFSNLFHR